MKYNRLTTAILLVVSLSFHSCESMLDKQLDDTVSDQQILQDPTLMSGLLVNVYNYIPRNDASYNCVSGAMLDCTTDDGVESSVSSDIHYMTNGAWGPSRAIDEQWGRMYSGIRAVALFFKYIDRSNVSNVEVLDNNGKPNENTFLKERYKAEATFLRALFYAELIKRYGDVPLVTEVLDPNPEALNLPRTPYVTVVDSIVKWCDAAAKTLPVSYSDVTKGRVTKGAALMLKSRVLLYAASKLNNPENDRQKWRLAAQAAQAVIKFSEENGRVYTLNGDFSAPFSTLFDKEIILCGKYYQRNDIELNNFPNGYDKGNGHTNPTQNLVDAFEIKENGTFVPYDPDNSAHIAKMYSSDRDPRLAKTVLYNGATFKGRAVETFVGGKDGLNLRAGFTRTGYYLAKFVLPEIDLNASNSTKPRAWIHFRYAEAYLNYAEAQNEYLSTPDQSVYDALNAVRERSMGVAGRLAEGTLDQVKMRNRIRNERRVEFAFEEHRTFDLRRWDIGDTYLNAPVKGIRIAKGGGNTTTEIFNVEERVFFRKMNRFPLSNYSVLKAPITGQTQDW